MKFERLLNKENPAVRINILNYGSIEVQLFPEMAPITVENFLKLVAENFYNDIIFHRVIKGFMIQAGDPTGTGCGGSKNKIKGEFMANGCRNFLEHTKGVISMARTNDPNSASSQFFIMHETSSHLDGMYAAFGAVISGIDVVDKIANVKTNSADKPIEDVIIKNIERIR